MSARGYRAAVDLGKADEGHEPAAPMQRDKGLVTPGGGAPARKGLRRRPPSAPTPAALDLPQDRRGVIGVGPGHQGQVARQILDDLSLIDHIAERMPRRILGLGPGVAVAPDEAP